MKIKGTVINGKNKGEKIGFPTVNLTLGNEIDGLSDGVYAGKIMLEDQEKKVAIFIDIANKLFEAHIIDFSGNLRGEMVEIVIEDKIREPIKFTNDHELIKKIKEDIEIIKNL